MSNLFKLIYQIIETISKHHSVGGIKIIIPRIQLPLLFYFNAGTAEIIDQLGWKLLPFFMNGIEGFITQFALLSESNNMNDISPTLSIY